MGELWREGNVCDGYIIQYEVEDFGSSGQVLSDEPRNLQNFVREMRFLGLQLYIALNKAHTISRCVIS